MTREERAEAKKIYRMLDECITPETRRLYKAYAKGLITYDEARQEIALNLFREATKQAHNF